MITLDSVEEYQRAIAGASQESVASGQSALEFLESVASIRPGDLARWVAFRRELLSARELREVAPYVEETGFFTEWPEEDRGALMQISFDLGEAVAELSLRERLQPYSPSQKIFKADPTLWDHVRSNENDKRVHELLDAKAFGFPNGSRLVSRNGWFFTIDPLLEPFLVTWAANAAKASEVHIRLNPHEAYTAPPPRLLTEATLRPVNRDWLPKLKLYKNSSDGGAYLLESPDSPSEDVERYWDYHVKGIRKLECSATRRAGGYLSMTIEELAEPRELKGWLMGRMIHLDTTDGVGTDFFEATLDHIDLAINVYEPEVALRRNACRLDHGKVEDASFRTHLIRADKVPFSTVLPFSFFFFRSRPLLLEWARDQFSGIDFEQTPS